MSGEHEDLVGAAVGLLAQGPGVPSAAEIAEVAGVETAAVGDGSEVLAEALLIHVGSTMEGAPALPPAGEGTVEDNLRAFVVAGSRTLARVAPVFARLAARPDVLARFHAMVGGDAAFGAGEPGQREPGGGGLPGLLTAYLVAEQGLGRIAPDVDVDAVVSLVVGTIHGQVLPPVLLRPGGAPAEVSGELAGRMAAVVCRGITVD